MCVRDQLPVRVRCAETRPLAQVRIDGVVDLEGCLPPPGAGWGGEKPAPVVTEPEAPRRSLRARTERTYVDGEEDPDEDEFMSDSEPPAPAQQTPPPLQQAVPPQPQPQPASGGTPPPSGMPSAPAAT